MIILLLSLVIFLKLGVYAESNELAIYGKTNFREEYSRGYIRDRTSNDVLGTSSGITVKKGPEIKSDTDQVNTEFYTANNTAKSEYIDYSKAARYVNSNGDAEWFDMRVYIWTNNSNEPWAVFKERLANLNFSGYMNAKVNQQTNMEFHFYTAGHCGESEYEQSFKGVFRVTDLDTYEGVCFLSGYERFYLAEGATVTYVSKGSTNSTNANNPFNKSGIAANPYFFGTVSANSLITQNVWVEINSTPSVPFKYIYGTNSRKESNFYYTGTAIEYYVDNQLKDTYYCVPYSKYILMNPSDVDEQKNGYTIDGWYTDNNYSTKIQDGITNENIIKVYGRFSPNKYTVKYNGNGATTGNTVDSIHTYNVAGNLTSNNFEKAYSVIFNHNYEGATDATNIVSYRFKNWNTKADGTGISYENNQQIINLTENNGEVINLYAIWEEQSENYIPTRVGYKFKGWYAEPECINKVEYASASGITLYAKWEQEIDLNETITIKLTKKWIEDNAIQSLRRPDYIKLIVTPIEENNDAIEVEEELLSNTQETENTNNEIPQDNNEIESKDTQDKLQVEDITNENQEDILNVEEKNEDIINENNVLESNNFNEIIKSRMSGRVSEIMNSNSTVTENNNVENKVVDNNNIEKTKTEENKVTENNDVVINEDETNNVEQEENNTQTNPEDKTNENLNIEDSKVETSSEETTTREKTEEIKEIATVGVEKEESLEFIFTEEVYKDKDSHEYILYDTEIGIPKYNKITGKEIKYKIIEEEVNPEDLKFYKTTEGLVTSERDELGNVTYTANIENTFTLPENNTKNLLVTKAWNDNGKEETRPENITLELIGRVQDIKLVDEPEQLNPEEQASDILKNVEDTSIQEELNNSTIEENIDNNGVSYKDISSVEFTVSKDTNWKANKEVPIYNENGQEIEYIVNEKGDSTVLNKYISETSEISETNEITITNNLIIKNSNITKKGLAEEINSIDSKLDYEIDYTVELDNKYAENATIEIVDTLPYQINQEKSDLQGGKYNYDEKQNIATITWNGTYNPTDKTITWENNAEEKLEETQTESTEIIVQAEPVTTVEATENNTQNVKVHINIGLIYKNIKVLEKNINNSAIGKIILSNNAEESTEPSLFATNARWIRNITVNTIWKGGTEETRPDSIELELSANITDENNQDTEYVLDESIEKTKILAKDTDWTATLWTELPSYDEEGKEIHYTIKEINLGGYKSEILSIDESPSNVEITIQNTKWYKLPITGGIGVDTIRSAEILMVIILVILLTNRKKVIPERRAIVETRKLKKLKKFAKKHKNI